MYIVGVDFSITSPSITLLKDGVIERMYAIRATKKQESLDSRIILLEYPLYKTDLERFDKLSNLLLNLIPNDIDYGYIEGYSYSSNGVVFNIAEATGLFKYKFFKKYNKELITLAPSHVKKHATEKGNSKKRQMLDAFKVKEFDMYNSFGLIDENLEKIKSPIDDLVDSYWVARCGEAVSV